MSYLLQRKSERDRAREFKVRILKPNTKRRVVFIRKPKLVFSRLFVLQDVTAQLFGKAGVFHSRVVHRDFV